MKLIRSSRCSLKFATTSKKQKLNRVLAEYGRVCNIFIEYFWSTGTPSKAKLLKDVVDIPHDTWLSARLRKVAAREAIDMIIAVKERWKKKPKNISIPVYRGTRMYVSSTIADLKESSEAKEFDAWLHLASIGEKVNMDLPIKFHKHFNKLASKGHHLNSYIITDSYVQFAFEIETGDKKHGKQSIGIDTGINALASTSTGHQFGLDIKGIIERIKRCEHGSVGQKTARRTLKQRMDEVAKEILQYFKEVDCVIVENLKNLGYKTKLKRRLSKNIRRSIGTWAYRYWLRRLQMLCDMNRVHFHEVPPQYTSQTCPCCGHIDRGNRNGTVFLCLRCGFAGNADVVGGRNILSRFLTGPYGAGYKPFNPVSLMHS
jgi:IS605 OrfB family transposase